MLLPLPGLERPALVSAVPTTNGDKQMKPFQYAILSGPMITAAFVAAGIGDKSMLGSIYKRVRLGDVRGALEAVMVGANPDKIIIAHRNFTRSLHNQINQRLMGRSRLGRRDDKRAGYYVTNLDAEWALKYENETITIFNDTETIVLNELAVYTLRAVLMATASPTPAEDK